MPRYERILPFIAIIVMGLGLILLVEEIHILTVTIPLPGFGPEAAWSITTVDGPGDVGAYTSLMLSRPGSPHIGYYNASNADLKYARYEGTSWFSTTVDSAGDVGAHTSLALDVADMPHLSYYDASNGDLRYARSDGTSWVTATVDSTGDVGLHTSLALDKSGQPRISYYDQTNSDLKFARFDGTSWFTTTVDSAANVGSFTSLALGPTGLPHVSYYDGTSGDLKYARFDGNSWTSETVDSDGDVGSYTSLALSTEGLAHISYYDGTSGDLKYAHFDGLSWTAMTLDSAGDVGLYTSLRLDTAAQPHITYYDASKGTLRYARFDGTSWVTATVDSEGDVGLHTSLALDRSGRPLIGYHDRTSADLKYAYFTEEAGFEIQISIPWLILFFLLIVMAVGTEVVHQEEAEEGWAAAPSGRRRYLRPAIWIVPVLLVLATFLFLRLLQGLLERSLGLVVAAGLLLLALVAQHYTHDERPRTRGLAHLVLDLLIYLDAFFLYGAIYTLKVRSLFSATTIVVLTSLLAFALLYRLASRGQAVLYAAAVGLCVGEITWPLNYWAVSGMVGGAFLLVIFYILVGLARQHLQGKLTRRLALEYVLVGLVLMAPIVVYALWPLLL